METVKVVSVKPLHDFVVAVEFSDGVEKEIDLSSYLHGEVFEPIRNDLDLFRSVRVVKGGRTISWPNGADIDPYTLYFGLTPEWSEEDEALAAALEQRRNGIPFIPTEMTKPKIGIH
jgi:hypothetical protein